MRKSRLDVYKRQAVLLLLCNVTKIPDAIVQIVQGAFGYGDGIQGIRAVAGGVLLSLIHI